MDTLSLIKEAIKTYKPVHFGYITKDGKVTQDRCIEPVEIDYTKPDDIKVWGRDMNAKRQIKRFDLAGIQEVRI